MKPEERAELEGVMHSRFMQWCDENDIRRVSPPGTPYEKALRKQKRGSPRIHGARLNAIGQFEMFSAEVIPLRPGTSDDDPPTRPEAA